MGADGEARIQEEDSLVRPVFKIAALRNGNSQIVVQFLEDVYERRGRFDAVGNREAQPVGLSRVVVRVLSDDDRLDLIDGAFVEGGENLGAGRIDRVLFFLLDERRLEMLKIRHFKLVAQKFKPCGVKFYHNPIR